MSRRAVLAAVVVLLALAMALAWWATRAPQVPSTTAHLAPLVRTLQFAARVGTVARVEVGSTLTGRVREVAVTEGTPVAAGQVLVRLDDAEWRAALAQAEASERQAQARLQGLRGPGRLATQASVAQAESVLAAAQADWQRTQALVAQGFLSQARLDEAQRTLKVAQAQLDSARAQLAANADGGSDVAQAQAQLAQATAARLAAQARLKEATITAPAAARVLSRSVEPGQTVQPGRPLLALALSGPVQLVAQVDERHLEQLAPGQPATVLADAYPTQPFQARVLSIAPVIDPQRGAIEVKFAPSTPLPAFVREDMTVSMEVETARRDQALVVPLAALRGDAANPTLWVARDGRVEARPVRLGLRTLALVEVLAGLRAGEAVLMGPSPNPGERVRTTAQPPQPALPNAPAGADAGSALTNAMGR